MMVAIPLVIEVPKIPKKNNLWLLVINFNHYYLPSLQIYPISIASFPNN